MNYSFLLIYPQVEPLELTLEETVERAQTYSPDAQTARHSFRSEYWNYKYYRANYLPSLTLTSNPYLKRVINEITLEDGTVKFVEQNMLSTDLSFQFTQNIPWTGGSVFLETFAQRIDMLSDRATSWQTSPINIGYSQSLFGYNQLKWDQKIEPVRYQEARKRYQEKLELIATNATDLFFALATAQSNLETALFNFAQADTLYHFAQGRYGIGTITENEMLQLEINRLTEETNQLNARIEVENSIQTLRSYLSFQEDVEIRVKLNQEVPGFMIESHHALLIATENSPDILQMLRWKLESENAVAQAKANAGIKANLYVRLGLTQTANNWKDAYKNPLDQQYISLGITLPILDWGRGKGKIQIARSQRDLVYTQVRQYETDFELNVRKLVKLFNLQVQRVEIAIRTDQTAQRRHDVARRLYLLGKSTILDLNASIAEKDSAKRSYINALHYYWTLYYTLRSITLYDFQQNKALSVNLEELIEN